MNRKFKFGDFVWDNLNNRKVIFSTYNQDDFAGVVVKEESQETSTYFSTIKTKYIEPYTGQDMHKEFEEKMKAMDKKFRDDMYREQIDFYKALNAKHPYTVILKSGVKVGVSEKDGRLLVKARVIVSGEDVKVAQTANLYEGDNFCFTNGEIAAIVPTENIL